MSDLWTDAIGEYRLPEPFMVELEENADGSYTLKVNRPVRIEYNPVPRGDQWWTVAYWIRDGR